MERSPNGAHTSSLRARGKKKTQCRPPSQGKGYWKCNVSILKDPHFMDDFQALWASLVQKADCDYTLEWWDSCKSTFENLIINHSCRLADNRRAILARLTSLLNKYKAEELNNPPYFKPLIGGVEAELATLLDSVYESAKSDRRHFIWTVRTKQCLSFYALKPSKGNIKLSAS